MIRMLQNISRRERLMLGLFAATMLLIWASLLVDRWEETSTALKEARAEANIQDTWLESEPLFRAQLRETLARLDTEQMLEGAGLTALVDSYARENGLKHELGTPRVEAGSISTRSNLRVTFRTISLEELIRFHLFLNARRPYIAVEGIAITANRADPRQLNARIEMSAIKVNNDDPTTTTD